MKLQVYLRRRPESAASNGSPLLVSAKRYGFPTAIVETKAPSMGRERKLQDHRAGFAIRALKGCHILDSEIGSCGGNLLLHHWNMQ